VEDLNDFSIMILQPLFPHLKSCFCAGKKDHRTKKDTIRGYKDVHASVSTATLNEGKEKINNTRGIIFS
jgi:hypothetical protein